MPTIAAMATHFSNETLHLPADIDGINVLPAILGKEPPSHSYLYYEFCTYHESKKGWGHAIRDGKWKAVSFFHKSQLELYDVVNDIREMHNLANEYPEIVNKLEILAKQAHTDSEFFPIEDCTPSCS